MTISQISKRESPLWQVIEYLQRNGSATIKELEDLLGVTTTAVRQHLTTLQVEGYIERRVVHSGVGRPHHAYFTTAKVQELFACQCDDLALTLLQEVFHLEGQERALQLLDRVGHAPGAQVCAQRAFFACCRSGSASWPVRSTATACWRMRAPQEDDTILLRTFNCPFHELAHEHREICEMDTNMMRKVLGSDVSLSSCMLDGHAGCTFVVKPGNAEQRA